MQLEMRLQSDMRQFYSEVDYNFKFQVRSPKFQKIENCQPQWQPAAMAASRAQPQNYHTACPQPQKPSKNSLKPFVVSVKAVRISIKAGRTLQWWRPSRRLNGLTIFSILSGQVCGMNQVCYHLVYLSAKFGALNQRINEISFSD